MPLDNLPPLTSFPVAFRPAQIGPYQVLAAVSVGTGGQVFRCRCGSDFRGTVAVKTLAPGHDSPAARLRFANERDCLQRIDHPGVVRLLGDHRDDRDHQAAKMPYFVMPWITGQTLTQAIADPGCDWQTKVTWFVQLADAVTAVHRCGVIHRDLKPSNVMIRHGVTGDQVRLIDFGLAMCSQPRSRRRELTSIKSRKLRGTLDYISPEQATSPDQVGEASDQYSLGGILSELLTGHVPRAHVRQTRLNLVDRLRLAQVQRPVRASHFVEAKHSASKSWATCPQRRHRVDAIVMRATATDPEDRFASVSHLASAVREILSRETFAGEGRVA